MRIIHTILALVLAASALPPGLHAADATAVRALLVSASNKKGAPDPRLANYEATLRRNLPFDTFRLAGEGATTVPAAGQATLPLGQGHHLDLQAEKGSGPGVRLKVAWMNGKTTVMSTSLTLQPGVPAVLGRRGGDEGETPVVLVIAN